MGNKLKAKLAQGAFCINGWSTFPCASTAEIFAQMGWDSVTYDMQHGLHDYQSVVSCIQATQAHSATPLVRVPWNEPGVIGKVLDAGAWGVICPMINTPDDARALVKACLYAPAGERSYGPIRAHAYGGPLTAYHVTANDEVLILPQIETREAVENLEAILDVPGISGVYMGPSDLGFSMGLAPVLDREEPEILALYERVIAETAKRKLLTGIQNNKPEYAARMAQMGFGLVTVANDMGLLAVAAGGAVAATRQAAAGAKS